MSYESEGIYTIGNGLRCIDGLLSYAGVRPVYGHNPKSGHPLTWMHRLTSDLDVGMMPLLPTEIRMLFVRVAYKLILVSIDVTLKQPKLRHKSFDTLLYHYVVQIIQTLEILCEDETQALSDIWDGLDPLYRGVKKDALPVEAKLVELAKMTTHQLLQHPEMQFDLLEEVRRLEKRILDRLQEIWKAERGE